MKRKILAVASFCVSALTLAVAAASAWSQSRFVLGMWNDPCVIAPFASNREGNERRFRLARQAHFNLLNGSAAQNYSLAYLDSVLDLCADNDLSTLVTIHGRDGTPAIDFHWPCTYDSSCPDFTSEAYQYALSSRAHFLPGRLSATRRAHFYGYFLGDEPSPVPDAGDKCPSRCPTSFLELKNVLQRYKTFDRGALGFMNILGMGAWPVAAYQAYVDSLCNDPNPDRRPDVIAYDDYPFHASGITPTYFRSLSILRRSAGARPLWATPLTTRWGDQAEPTQGQIQFMTSCPIAYGVKGLLYFTYNIPHPYKPHPSFGEAIVINCDDVTWKWSVVQRINDYLENVVGPVVMSSQWLGAYHVAAYPTGQIIPESERFAPSATPVVADITGKEILFGVFKGSSRTYLWVVNKDATNTSTTSVSLKGNRTGSVELGPSEIGYTSGGSRYQSLSTKYDSSRDITRLPALSLQPGEGRLIRIQ